MTARKMVTLLLLGALVAGLTSGSAIAAKKKKTKAGPMVVGTDDAGDWGANADPTVAPLGEQLGQDLVEATIAPGEEKGIVNFIIKVTALPANGGVPEASRYNWDIIVDGDAYQLTGAWTEYIRGVCNPLHTGACPPPQDPGQQPFMIRTGPCTVGSDCFLEGIVQATFDPAEGTITVPVPLDLIGAKPGSKIAPGTSTMGGTVYAAPAAMVSNASLPNDTMLVLKTFTGPK